MLWNLIEAKKTETKMTQTQIAELLRISPAYISRIKFGSIVPSYEVAQNLASWLGITTGQVFDAVPPVDERQN